MVNPAVKKRYQNECQQAAARLAKCGTRKRAASGQFVSQGPSKRKAAPTPMGPSAKDLEIRRIGPHALKGKERASALFKKLSQTRKAKGPNALKGKERASALFKKLSQPRTDLVDKTDKLVKEAEKSDVKQVAKKKVKDASKKSDSKIVTKMKRADVDLPEVKEILRDHLKSAYKKDPKRDADLKAVSKAKNYADPIFAKYWSEGLKDEIKFLTAADKIKTSMKKEKKAFKEADFSDVKDMLTKFRKDGKSKRKWVKKQRKQLKAEGTDFKKNLRNEIRQDKKDAKRKKKFLAQKALEEAAKPPTPEKPPTPKKPKRRIAPMMVEQK